LFTTLLSPELPNGSFQDGHAQKTYDSALMHSPLFLLICSQKMFLRTRTNVKIDSAVSSGSQGKLTHFMAAASGRTVDCNVLFLIYAS
jgi:hypothetical protein